MGINMKFKQKLTACLSVAGALLPMFARAELPPGNAITISDINGLGYTALEFLYGLSLTLAVIFIVWSGIMMMTARDNPTAFQKAGLNLKHAVIGFAFVFGAGVIINTVASIVDRSFFCQVSVVGICLY